MTIPEKKNELEDQQTVTIEPEDDWATDEQFNRLRRMTETLIEEAQRALVYQVVDVSGYHRSRRSVNSKRHRQHRSEESKR